MNKNFYIGFLFAVAWGSLNAIAQDTPDKQALKTEAKAIIKQFAGTLKPQLRQAINSGGLVHAINVCSAEAPRIAQRLSEENGWRVKRVSLKARNAGSATPDDFERQVLEQFDARQARGDKVRGLAYSAVVDNRFRFMMAQEVEGVCLNCHGQSIHPDVKDTLNALYPQDLATGYVLGQVRGAFSLVKDL